MDYYTFGWEMPGRKYNSSEYRYGFNGKEKDQNGEFGSITNYDYGFRIFYREVKTIYASIGGVKTLIELTKISTYANAAKNVDVLAKTILEVIDGLNNVRSTLEGAPEIINELANEIKINK